MAYCLIENPIVERNFAFQQNYLIYIWKATLSLKTFQRKFFSRYRFLKSYLLQSDNELIVLEMQDRIGGRNAR